MKHTSLKSRLLSTAILLAILLPLISLTTYGYGIGYRFDFSFNGSTNTWWTSGNRIDPNNLHASIDIETGDFGIGAVRFRFLDRDYYLLAGPIEINTFGYYYLTYDETAIKQIPDKTIRFGGTPTNPYVWACGGTFSI